MVRHSALTTMFKLILAAIAALLLVGIGTVTVPAGAHHCGCQEDNSGTGSTSSGSDSSGSGESGSGSSGSGSSGSDEADSNSGTGNGDGCVSNSGSGNAGGDNSGSGNAGDDCPADQPDDNNNPGDSNNPSNNTSSNSNNTSGSVSQTADTGTVVAGAQAPAGSTQAVPTAVAAGVTGEQDSGSTLGALMILLGVATMFAALLHRRSRA